MLVILKVILIVCVLLAVAFFTLFERKILGYAQTRLGPNKVPPLGVTQPLGDACKLLTKARLLPARAQLLYYIVAPLLALGVSLLGFFTLLDAITYKSLTLAVLFIIFILSLGVFPLSLAGWASNSEYRTLGRVRALAQTLRYEVLLFLTIITPFFCRLTFSLHKNRLLL